MRDVDGKGEDALWEETTRKRRESLAVEAVAESADFQPAYDGEDFVTFTFRVPKDSAIVPGIWELKPVGPGERYWAQTKSPKCQ